MAEITISINGRPYDIACDNGQERRVADLAAYIDQRIQRVARGAGAENEAHLFVLAMLTLTDELFDARDQAQAQAAPAAQADGGISKVEEQALARALASIAKKIEGLSSRLGQAA